MCIRDRYECVLIEASTWFTYPWRMEGWVDFGGWFYTKIDYLFASGYPSNYLLIATWPGVEPQSLDHKSDAVTVTLASQLLMSCSVAAGATRERRSDAERSWLGEAGEAEACNCCWCSTANYWQVQQHPKTARSLALLSIKLLFVYCHPQCNSANAENATDVSRWLLG